MWMGWATNDPDYELIKLLVRLDGCVSHFNLSFSNPMPQAWGHGAQPRSPAERVRMIARHRWTGMVRFAEVDYHSMPADFSDILGPAERGHSRKPSKVGLLLKMTTPVTEVSPSR